MKRANLELLLAWLDALRRRDVEALRAVLDPAVVWRGLREELCCKGPDGVVEGFLAARDEGFEIDLLELIPAPTHVVLGVVRPALREFAGVPLEGRIYNVFTVAEGRITRIEDHARRESALTAAGLTGP